MQVAADGMPPVPLAEHLAQPAAEIGDGGFADWTAKLLASKKERLLISGYGLDRLAVLIDDEEIRS